jgi:hypothetical protein
MISVIEVDAVIDDEEVSAPAMIKVYVPFAAFVELDDDPEPQEDIPKLRAAIRKSPAYARNFFGRDPSSPTRRTNAMLIPAFATFKLEFGRLLVPERITLAVNKRLVFDPFAEALAHTDSLV